MSLNAWGYRSIMKRRCRPTVSEHLAALRSVGLVTSSKRGRERVYRLDTAPLRDVTDWVSTLEAFWDERFDRLGRLLQTIYEEDGR